MSALRDLDRREHPEAWSIVDRLKEDCSTLERERDEAQRQRDEARAEGARLRAALMAIAGVGHGMGVHRPCCARGSEIARAALAAKPEVKP